MSIFRKFISAFFALALMLGLHGCLEGISLIPYGKDPFQPHFAEESIKERGTLSGTKLKVRSFYVSKMKYPELIAEETVWGFHCPRKGIRVKEIVYGIVPEGCTEVFPKKPLKPMTVYSVDGSFGRSTVGGGTFIISDKNGEYEFQYPGPENDELSYIEWVTKIINSPAHSVTNTPGAE